MMKSFTCFAFFSLTFTSYAAVIRDYDPARHDRFTTSFPSAPVESTSFYQSGLDWSGVGWNKSDSRMGITMISEKHFIVANHFTPGVFDDKGTADTSDDTGIVSFLGSGGAVFDYQVSSLETLSTTYIDEMGDSVTTNSDVAIGTLSSSIDPTILHYSILSANDTSDFLGVDLLHYGQGGSVGTGQIDQLGLVQIGSNTSFAYISGFAEDDMATAATGDDLRFTGGDSSSPSFYVKDNELILSGTHSGIGLGVTDGNYLNFDSLSYFYADQINTILMDDGQAASFEEVVPIPEPTISFFLASSSLLFLRRKRSRT